MSFAQFVQDVVTTFSQDFGVSSFFSSPNAAANWVEEHVILPNPRLTEQEKGILLFWSEESLDFANYEVGSTSISGRDGAYIYWNLMRDYVTYHTYDQRLYDLFDVAQDAAFDVSTPTTTVIADSFKIPWWLIVLPILFFMRKK